MTQLSEWNGTNAIFVIVDRFFKLAKMVQLRLLQQLLIWLSCSLICGLGITECHNLLLVIEAPSLR
jgi:hypothetical protein